MKKITILMSILFAFFVSQAQITADFTWSDPQCSGGSITFTDASSGDPSLGWSWRVEGDELGSDSTFTYLFPLVTTATNFDISLYVTATTGYNDNHTYTVTIYPLPNATIDIINPTICEGTNIALTENAGDATSWAWSSGETTAGINPTVTTATTYTVTVTDVNQCTNTASSTVSTYALPNVVATPASPTVCPGDPVTINATGADTYSWNTGETTDSVVQAPMVQTDYTVIGTDSNGCVNTAIASVDVFVLPTVTIDDLAPAICDGESLTLTASGASSYAWSNGINTSVMTEIPTASGTYTVTGTDVNGCIDTESSYVTVNPLPNAEIDNIDPAICDGSNVVLTASGGVSYLWSDGTATAIADVSPSTQTTYTVTVTDTNNCSSTAVSTVSINPVYNNTDSVDICAGDSILWQSNYYSSTGVYTFTYSSTVTGCDSIVNLDLTVNPLPQLVTVLYSPSTGILPTSTTGEISLSTSYTTTNYWTTKGAAMFSGNIAGTGSSLSLGTNYVSGTYDVWSENAQGCTRKQGNVTFAENTGTTKIIGTPTYGDNFTSFTDGAVDMTLYLSAIDIYGDTVILVEDGPIATSGGNVEFDNLSAGDYYLKSELSDTINFPTVVPVFFYDGPTVDSADVISISSGDIEIRNVNHPEYSDTTGSNTAGGIVDTLGGGTKSIMSTGLSDQIVILRNEITGEILSAVITDSNGDYFIDNVPDNADLELYVTSFQYQNWTPAGFTSATGTHYTFNFIAAGDSVYPDGTTGLIELNKPQNIEFSIYPNPATNQIYFDNIPDNAKLEIFNLSGQKIAVDTRSHHNSLDVSSFAPGVYSVVITTEDNTSIGAKKFVKK